MALTVESVHSKEFTRKMRGYNEIEVDDFLDEVAKELGAQNARIAELEAQLKATGEQLAYMKNLEVTLRDTLVTAQRSADETVMNAQRKADTIIGSAEEQSKIIVQRAKDEVVRAQTEVDAVRQQLIVYKANFRKLVDAQMQLIHDPLFGGTEDEGE